MIDDEIKQLLEDINSYQDKNKLKSIKESTEELLATFSELDVCYQRIRGRRKFNHLFEPIFNAWNNRGSSVTNRDAVDSPPEILRKYRPETYEEFERLYFQHARNKAGQKITEKTFHDQGQILKERIKKSFSEMGLPHPEIPDLCYAQWVRNLVFGKTWDGVRGGEDNIKNWINDDLEVVFSDPPEGVDAEMGVDLMIKVGRFFIGIQIKPSNFRLDKQEVRKYERKWAKFTSKYGGKVFLAYYDKDTLLPKTPKGKLLRKNQNLISQIKSEIFRLDNVSEEE